MSACCFSIFIITSVACAIGPSVNPLQNRETQHVNIVLQCMYLNGKPSSVTHVFSTDFSFQNLVFFGIYLNFQCQKSLLKINISHISESQCYQINSIKSCSSRSFQEHQRYIPIPLKFSAMI